MDFSWSLTRRGKCCGKKKRQRHLKIYRLFPTCKKATFLKAIATKLKPWRWNLISSFCPRNQDYQRVGPKGAVAGPWGHYVLLHFIEEGFG